jgi:hypothetical protein
VINPSLHGLLIQAHVDELHRAELIYNRGADAPRLSTVPRFTLITRATNRIFPGASAVNAEAPAVHGFATLRTRS